MAFDLVQYFAEQIKIQKPELLIQYSDEERLQYISEANTLSLGKLITLMRQDGTKLYHEIQTQDHLYIQELARHLTTSPQNQSLLAKPDLEHSLTTMLDLQLAELKQLDVTGNFGEHGIRELLVGQIEHLSGLADDWVWTTSELTELIGSKPKPEEELSLEETMKEFNQMVNQHTTDHSDQLHTQVVEQNPTPTWAKLIEPAVAIVILWGLYCAASQMFV